MSREIFVSGFAAAILEYLVGLELRNMPLCGPITFGKSRQGVPVKSERLRHGSEKIGLEWFISHPSSHAYNIITLGLTTPRIGVLEQVWWAGAHYVTETRFQCRYHNFLSAVPFDRQIVWYNLTDFITIYWHMNIERLAFSSNRLHRIPWLNVVFDPLLLPSTNTNQLSRRRSLFGIGLRVFW